MLDTLMKFFRNDKYQSELWQRSEAAMRTGFLILMTEMKVETALAMLTDDARVDIVGRGSYDGKAAIKDIITELKLT